MDTDVNKTSVDNRLYASCSSCGHILGRALSGSDNEVQCPKCGAKINYRVAESIVTITLLKPSPKKPSKKEGKNHHRNHSDLVSTINK